MKKLFKEKEPLLRVCNFCAWAGLKYREIGEKGKCDMCGKTRNKIYLVRSCNLQ